MYLPILRFHVFWDILSLVLMIGFWDVVLNHPLLHQIVKWIVPTYKTFVNCLEISLSSWEVLKQHAETSVHFWTMFWDLNCVIPISQPQQRDQNWVKDRRVLNLLPLHLSITCYIFNHMWIIGQEFLNIKIKFWVWSVCFLASDCENLHTLFI